MVSSLNSCMMGSPDNSGLGGCDLNILHCCKSLVAFSVVPVSPYLTGISRIPILSYSSPPPPLFD